MDKFNQVMKKILPALRDVVGIDFGTSATKAVRIKADNSGAMTVVAADILPPCTIDDSEGDLAPIAIPAHLAAWTAALSYTSRKSVVKLVNEPKGTTYGQQNIPELMGLPKDHNLRIGMARFDAGEEDKSVLLIGVPEKEIVKLPKLLPVGKPVTASAEVSSLAAFSCYSDVYGDETSDGCDLVMEIGENVTLLGLFVKKRPLVIRQFAESFSTAKKAVMRDFQTDENTARDIILSGQVDISGTIHSAMGSILRQAGIAVDFTERRTGARLQRILVCGGFARNPGLRAEIRSALTLEPILIDPWKNMKVLPDAISAAAKDSGACFAAATACAIASLEGK